MVIELLSLAGVEEQGLNGILLPRVGVLHQRDNSNCRVPATASTADLLGISEGLIGQDFNNKAKPTRPKKWKLFSTNSQDVSRNSLIFVSRLVRASFWAAGCGHDMVDVFD